MLFLEMILLFVWLSGIVLKNFILLILKIMYQIQGCIWYILKITPKQANEDSSQAVFAILKIAHKLYLLSSEDSSQAAFAIYWR